jgi:hypothetical protein
VEWWDEIGGEMILARQRQAVAARPHETGAGKKTVSRGTEKMKAAAGMTLETFSDEIADSLYQSVLKGNASIAKLLFALAEGQIDCEDEVVMERLFAMTEKLASEKEWAGPVDEEEAETGFEQPEPKG